MTKITLPALLRNGFTAVPFYQSHGITITLCNGFDAAAVLPENATIAQQGKKSKLYVNNQLIGCFEPGAYKVRFDPTKAVAYPKKHIPKDIAEDAKFEKIVRTPKTKIVNFVSLLPVVTILVDTLNTEKKQSVPKGSSPKAPKPEKALSGRQKGCVLKESKKAISDAEAQIATLINSGTPKYEIANQLGVSKGTLYRYLNDKGIVTPAATDARRKRDIDLPKEKWITLAMRYKTDIEAIAKYAKCSRSTAYARLKEYVPVEFWQTTYKSKENPIPLNCDFWLSIHAKHNGNFDTIALELQCKVSSAKTYFYKSGAGALHKANKKANKKPKVPRVYTEKATRQKRVPTELKDKALWERLAQEYSTVKEMAQAIGKSVHTCYAYLKKYLPCGDWKKQKPDIKTNKNFWLSMYEKHGKNWQAIADELGYTLFTVRQYFITSGAAAQIAQNTTAEREKRLKEEGLKRFDFIDQRKTPTRRLQAAAPIIIDMMNNGATITAIRKAFNTHYDTVSSFLKQPEIASQICYTALKGAASYELRLLHPKEKIAAATSETKTINKLRDMLGIDKRTVKALMIAYDILFKKKKLCCLYQ